MLELARPSSTKVPSFTKEASSISAMSSSTLLPAQSFAHFQPVKGNHFGKLIELEKLCLLASFASVVRPKARLEEGLIRSQRCEKFAKLPQAVAPFASHLPG